MIVKVKKECIVTIQDFSELGLNSSPFINIDKEIKTESIDSEVHILMSEHGMSQEDAEKAHRENLEWAL